MQAMSGFLAPVYRHKVVHASWAATYHLERVIKIHEDILVVSNAYYSATELKCRIFPTDTMKAL